ncbi:MAG: sporulation protein [Oscillospiraceae bacterium]|nr:sporulation protein [Oscillospiraceae bacterium]
MKWREIPEETAHLFDLPMDAAAGLPRVTLIGRKRICVENHRGLLGYSTERVEIGGGRVRVCITGCDLYLRVMKKDAIVITGEIHCVELL